MRVPNPLFLASLLLAGLAAAAPAPAPVALPDAGGLSPVQLAVRDAFSLAARLIAERQQADGCQLTALPPTASSAAPKPPVPAPPAQPPAPSSAAPPPPPPPPHPPATTTTTKETPASTVPTPPDATPSIDCTGWEKLCNCTGLPLKQEFDCQTNPKCEKCREDAPMVGAWFAPTIMV